MEAINRENTINILGPVSTLHRCNLQTDVFKLQRRRGGIWMVTPEEFKWITLQTEPLLSLFALSFIYKAYVP